MSVHPCVALLADHEQQLARTWRTVTAGHAAEADLHHLGTWFANQCDQDVAELQTLLAYEGARPTPTSELALSTPVVETRPGPVGFLRDLHGLASFCEMAWTLLDQAAAALRDHALHDAVATYQLDTTRQCAWLRTRLTAAAPQALVATLEKTTGLG